MRTVVAVSLGVIGSTVITALLFGPGKGFVLGWMLVFVGAGLSVTGALVVGGLFGAHRLSAGYRVIVWALFFLSSVTAIWHGLAILTA